MGHVVLMTTTETKEQACTLAKEALGHRLAACVQIVGPLVSVFRWKGEIEQAEEFRCEMKTSTQHVSKLQSLILEHHPYELPELVTLPFSSVSERYGNWIDEELSQ